MTQFKQLDEEFNHFLNSVIQETKDSELTEKKKAMRRKLADNDEFQFCKIYFPGIFTEEFNQLHAYIKGCTNGNYTVGGCRQFGKSAYTFTAKVIRPIAQGIPGLIGIAMRTQEDAVERTSAIIRLIRRNKMLLYDYGIIFQQDKKGYYIVNGITLVGVGVNEGLRNFIDDDFKRFRVMICDDLYNRTTVSSEKDNEKVYNFVTSEVWGQMETDGLSLWLFNYISQTSPGSKIAENYPANHFNLPALNESDETNWPQSAKFTTAYMHKLRRELPYEVWTGDYMNQPVLVGEILDPAWIKTTPIKPEELTSVIIAVDPSFGQSPSACSKGAAVLGITTGLNFVLLDIYIRKEDYTLLFDWLYSQVQKYHGAFKAVLFENDFNQWAFAQPYYIEWVSRTKQHLPLVDINSKESKTEFYGSDKTGRIMNLVHPYQTGKLTHSADIPKGQDLKLFLAQYMSFGKASVKLDGLDALATAFIKILQYISSGTFTPIKPRSFSNKEDNWLQNR